MEWGVNLSLSAALPALVDSTSNLIIVCMCNSQSNVLLHSYKYFWCIQSMNLKSVFAFTIKDGTECRVHVACMVCIPTMGLPLHVEWDLAVVLGLHDPQWAHGHRLLHTPPSGKKKIWTMMKITRTGTVIHLLTCIHPGSEVHHHSWEESVSIYTVTCLTRVPSSLADVFSFPPVISIFGLKSDNY